PFADIEADAIDRLDLAAVLVEHRAQILHPQQRMRVSDNPGRRVGLNVRLRLHEISSVAVQALRRRTRAKKRPPPPRILGSSMSRRASPNMLMPKTASVRAMPGKAASQGAWNM